MSIENFKQVPFLLLNEHPQREKFVDQYAQVFRGFDRAPSKLGEIFFCGENIELLQKQIILTVLKKTNFRIPFQDVEKLVIVMRYIYNTEARNLPCNIKEQIRELNNKVTESVVPDIITNIELQNGYLEKIYGEFKPIDLPIHVSNRQPLPSITTVWDNEMVKKWDKI